MKRKRTGMKVVVQMTMIFGIIACFAASTLAAANVKKEREDTMNTAPHVTEKTAGVTVPE